MFNSDRIFRLWLYKVSHSGMLIRSDKIYGAETAESTLQNTTIDVDFQYVSYINIPTDLYGLSISAVQFPEHLTRYEKESLKCFEIASEWQTYYVVASTCRVGISNMKFNEHMFNGTETRYSETIIIG